MSDAATQTALHQIFDRLGNIDGRISGIEDRLDTGSRRHEEFSQQIAELDAKVEPVGALKETVVKMQPIVDDYQKSRQMLAGFVLAIGAVASGLMIFASDIKAWFLARLGLH